MEKNINLVRFGRMGEEEACKWLLQKGYRIQDRNYCIRGGEIDIIAWDGDVLVFVEVKTRTSNRYGTGFDAVTSKKQKRLCHAARQYIMDHKIADVWMRFDVIEVRPEEETFRIHHIKNAFEE